MKKKNKNKTFVRWIYVIAFVHTENNADFLYIRFFGLPNKEPIHISNPKSFEKDQ